MDYAIVTGATSGIGLALAEKLLSNGCYVFLNYYNNELKKDEVNTYLTKYNNQFEFIRADMTEYNGIEVIIESIRKKNIKVKYLILNFGLTDRTKLFEVTLENWERVMRSNVNIPFFMIQKMFNESFFYSDSSILCISSILASFPHSTSVSYGVSKSALSSLAKNLSKFLAPYNIRINAIEPGFVNTQWQKDKPLEHKKRIETKINLGRMGEPDEIAEMGISILKNSYLTGEVIPISGGYCMI